MTENTLSIVPAEPAADSTLAAQGGEILDIARRMVIASAADAERAACALTKVVKPFKSRVADFFKPLKKAQDEAKKRILEAEESILGPAKEAEAILKGKIATWTAEEEERRKAAAAAASKADPELAAVVPMAPAGPVKVAGVTMRETWRAEVTDSPALFRWVAEDLPNRADYILPNMEALDRWAKGTHGRPPLPGVEAFSEKVVAAGRG